MKTNSRYIGLLACFLMGGAAQASQIYTYTLNVPSIVAGSEVDAVMTQYQFSWVGPLMYNAPPNTACPTVCGPVIPGSTVKAGYRFAGFDFTAYLPLSDAEPQINFVSNSDPSNTIVFSFIEPDSFWAQQTGITSFPSNGNGTGASYVVGGTDPVCTGCTVSIAAASSAPEPRTSILVGGIAGIFAFMMGRKRAKSIG